MKSFDSNHSIHSVPWGAAFPELLLYSRLSIHDPNICGTHTLILSLAILVGNCECTAGRLNDWQAMAPPHLAATENRMPYITEPSLPAWDETWNPKEDLTEDLIERRRSAPAAQDMYSRPFVQFASGPQSLQGGGAQSELHQSANGSRVSRAASSLPKVWTCTCRLESCCCCVKTPNSSFKFELELRWARQNLHD